MNQHSRWSVLVLIANIWAIVKIMQSGADTANKVLWTMLVIVLPVLGSVLWYFVDPRTGRSRSPGAGFVCFPRLSRQWLR